LSSQTTYAKKIKRLNRSVNLDDPTGTERYILALERSSKYKQSLLLAYRHYCLANNIIWKPPSIKVQSAPIIVPTEERIDKIINRATLKFVVVFQISKHGLRPCEVSKITLRDIDFQRGLITVKTSKLGAARTIRLKENVLLNLKAYVQRKNISDLNLCLFPSPNRMREQWNRYRKRAFLNFRDQEFLKIRLYDLRHWFATSQYMKTRDLLHVKYLLGHRNIESTMIYVHLSQGLLNCSEDYSCKTAKSVKEATELIESGFEYESISKTQFFPQVINYAHYYDYYFALA